MLSDPRAKKTRAIIKDKCWIHGAGAFCWVYCSECGTAHMATSPESEHTGWEFLICLGCKAEIHVDLEKGK